MVLGRSTMVLGRYTMVLVRSTMVLGRSTMVLGRSTLVSCLVWNGLVWSIIHHEKIYGVGHADKQTHQYPDSDRPKGRAE